MKITRTSELSGKEHTMDIDISEEDLYKVENRRMLDLKIQQIIPHIPADQREFLITGITDSEWDEMCGIQDNEEATGEPGAYPAW